MTTVQVPLPAELDAFVREQVASGAYADAAAVIREALERLAADAAFPYEARIEALRRAIAPGLEDAAAGRVSDRSIDQIVTEAMSRVRKG